MKIAITGCNGSVGKRVVLAALQQNHSVVGVDRIPTPIEEHGEKFTYIQVDLHDFDATLKAMEGCEGVVHLAGHRNPGDYLVTTHNRCVLRVGSSK